MKKLSFLFVLTAVFSVLKTSHAQTDLMQDVDAVKENNDDDLYAPDDEAQTSSAAAPAPSAAAPAPEAPASKSARAPETSPPPSGLEDLPVDPQGMANRPSSALTGISDGEPAELSAIRIYSLDDRTRYEIQTSKVVDFAPEFSTADSQFVLNLANTRVGPLVARSPIKADEYPGPVRQVQAYESKSALGSNSRVVMQLTSMVQPMIKREGNRLLVDFLTNGVPPMAKQNRSRGQGGNDLPDYEMLISLNGKQVFNGTKVNFRAKDASLPDVMQFLSQVSGKNFVMAEESEKKISMNVKSVPWDQVLALVLLNADLGYQKLGNTYRVMPVVKIRQEIADSIKAQEDEDKLAPKATQLFPLSYSKTTEVVPQLLKLLKPDYNESVVSDDRTNSLVVTALPKNIQRIRRYLEAIDKQTPIVQIEARIVQAKKEFSREIGINWKALSEFKIANGTLNLFTALGDSTTETGFGGSGFYNQLGETGGAGQNYVNSTGASLKQLDTVLRFAESKDITKELARPSLTVLNNKKANIVDGTQITFIVPAEGDTASSVQTVEASLSLTVTPQVTNDNNIMLNLILTRNSFGKAPAIDKPTIPIDKREITTETLVESGNTVVVGGIYIKEDLKGESGWPFFRSIPIFGRLFTATDSTKELERELLMFISPRILNLEKASVYQQSLEEAR